MKNTRRNRKLINIRDRKWLVTSQTRCRSEMLRAIMLTKDPNERPMRYGSKLHRKELAKITGRKE